jgi:hypothetical protein
MRPGRLVAVTWGLNLALLTAVGCKDDIKDDTPKYGELTTLAGKWGSNKGNRGHRFTGVYELFFHPMKYEVEKVLEIGVLKGASLRMWHDYFPNAVIHGVDIEDTSSNDTDAIRTYIADQASREQLQAVLDAAGSDFDIVLDDGGHSMEQQQVSFGYLFKHVKPGGYYVIEDVHTSIYDLYQDSYGATESGENTTLAMIDHFIRTGSIESEFMTAEEKADLTKNLESANLLSQKNGRAITCIFKKKSGKETPGRKARNSG